MRDDSTLFGRPECGGACNPVALIAASRSPEKGTRNTVIFNSDSNNNNNNNNSIHDLFDPHRQEQQQPTAASVVDEEDDGYVVCG